MTDTRIEDAEKIITAWDRGRAINHAAAAGRLGRHVSSLYLIEAAYPGVNRAVLDQAYYHARKEARLELGKTR